MSCTISMATTSDRATFVCDACRNRKRTCDKRLPACSYCSRKGMNCVYVDRPIAKKVGPPSLNGLSFDRTTASALNLFGFNQSNCFEVGNADSATYAQVQACLEYIGLRQPEIITSYFDGFHQWLPIVDPAEFHDGLNTVHASPRTVGCSLLLLAMTLIVLPDLLAQTSSVPISQKQIYLQTKMLFSQAQVQEPRSIAVIQAGLLIAAHEYVSRDIGAAYVTTCTCIAMIRLLPPSTGSLEWPNIWSSFFILHT